MFGSFRAEKASDAPDAVTVTKTGRQEGWRQMATVIENVMEVSPSRSLRCRREYWSTNLPSTSETGSQAAASLLSRTRPFSATNESSGHPSAIVRMLAQLVSLEASRSVDCMSTHRLCALAVLCSGPRPARPHRP